MDVPPTVSYFTNQLKANSCTQQLVFFAAQDFVTKEQYNTESDPEEPSKEKDQSDDAIPPPENRSRGLSVDALSSSRSKLKVGSRCYAKFSNGEWYWGHIAEVKGNGETRLYSVSCFPAVVHLCLHYIRCTDSLRAR